MSYSQEIGKGYGFAYAAWVRQCEGRCEMAAQGATWFLLFADWNGVTP